MEARSCLAIVLAAGEGTRMRSARPKVLHAIAGRSLLAHVLTAVAGANTSSVAVVIGPGQDAVAGEAKRVLPSVSCFVQHERKGTAHAVLAAKSTIAEKLTHAGVGMMTSSPSSNIAAITFESACLHPADAIISLAS